MSTKRILFILLCALLVIILVLTGVAISRIGNLFGLNTTPAATEPPVPIEGPTEPQATQHQHSYILTDTIKATCDGYGWNIYTCQGCQQTHMPVDERMDPLGHNYEATTVTEATCTEAGYAEYTCTRCSKTDVPADKQQEPLGHNFDHGRVHEATCTEGGYTQSTCLRCGITETKDQTEALGHQYGEPVVFPATCTEDAYTVATCTLCAAEDKVIEVGTATGHIPGVWHFQGPNAFYLHCEVCACSLRETAAEGVAYDILLDFPQAATDETGAAYTIRTVTVGVPGDSTVKMFSYTINDYLGDESLSVSYQAGVGFVMTFLVDGVEQSYSVDHCQSLTITIAADGIPSIA